jgi:hypothetical protein
MAKLTDSSAFVGHRVTASFPFSLSLDINFAVSLQRLILTALAWITIHALVSAPTAVPPVHTQTALPVTSPLQVTNVTKICALSVDVLRRDLPVHIPSGVSIYIKKSSLADAAAVLDTLTTAVFGPCRNSVLYNRYCNCRLSLRVRFVCRRRSDHI